MTASKTTWLTAKDAAAHATVSVWAIRQAVTAGELQAYPVGTRGDRLTAEDVDNWLKSRSYEPGYTA